MRLPNCNNCDHYVYDRQSGFCLCTQNENGNGYIRDASHHTCGKYKGKYIERKTEEKHYLTTQELKPLLLKLCRPKGKWEASTNGTDYRVCSNCLYERHAGTKYNYCPACGADMREE